MNAVAAVASCMRYRARDFVLLCVLLWFCSHYYSHLPNQINSDGQISKQISVSSLTSVCLKIGILPGRCQILNQISQLGLKSSRPNSIQISYSNNNKQVAIYVFWLSIGRCIKIKIYGIIIQPIICLFCMNTAAVWQQFNNYRLLRRNKAQQHCR